MGKGRERFGVVPNKMKAVWWDINSCPIPAGYDPRRVRPSIESALNKSSDFSVGVGDQVSIFAIGNLIRLTPGERIALSSSGIFMRHTDFFSGSIILSEILDWQYENRPPATVMLISEDRFADLEFHGVLVNGDGVWAGRYTVLPAYPRAKGNGNSWRWKTILNEAPTPSQMLVHKCTGKPLWICTLCEFETDTYGDFVDHIYGPAHDQLLYEHTHFPPTYCDIYDQFVEDKARIPKYPVPDLEQVSLSNLVTGPKKDAARKEKEKEKKRKDKKRKEKEKKREEAKKKFLDQMSLKQSEMKAKEREEEEEEEEEEKKLDQIYAYLHQMILEILMDDPLSLNLITGPSEFPEKDQSEMVLPKKKGERRTRKKKLGPNLRSPRPNDDPHGRPLNSKLGSWT